MTEKELEELESNPEGNHSCPKCGKEVPNERALAVKTMRCTACTPQGFRPKALYFSEEKEGEGGCMVVLQDESSLSAARSFYTDSSEEEAESLNNGEKLRADD